MRDFSNALSAKLRRGRLLPWVLAIASVALDSCSGLVLPEAPGVEVTAAELDPPVTIQLSPDPGGDTWLYQNNPDQPHGTDPYFYGLQGLVQFDPATVRTRVGIGVPIVSARLELYTSGGSGLYVLQDVAAGTTWTEAAATWNCPVDTNLGNSTPDCTSQGWDQTRASAPIAYSNAAVLPGGVGWVAFDVTDDVRRMIATSASTHNGFLVSGGGGTFVSRESGTTSQHPRLVIQAGPVAGYAPLEPVASTVPRLDVSTPTHVYDAMSWLTSPTFSLDWVSPGAISVERAALVRGRVLDPTGTTPLAGVEVSVVGHPEMGRTRTRLASDGVTPLGTFELLVNGGSPLVLRFRRDATIGGTQYIDAERTVEVPWNGWAYVPDVRMTPRTELSCLQMATGLMLGAAVNDTSGTARGARQLGLYVPSGTTVTPAPVGTPVWCLAEHTRRGTAGMPADLPGTTAYTFAFEAEVHNSGGGASTSSTRIEHPAFNQSVYAYLITNPSSPAFVNAQAGTVIPSGTLDADSGQWSPGPNGVAIEIVSPCTMTVGISGAELTAVCGNPSFTTGTRFWRVPLQHFSSPDFNFLTGLLSGDLPDGDPDESGDVGCDSAAAGSIIHCESGTLGERVPLTGTPYSLMYLSDRQRGRRDAYRVRFTPLANSGAVTPTPDAVLSELAVTDRLVPGGTFTGAQITAPQEIAWDGLDAYARDIIGPQVAYLRLGFRWNSLPYQTSPSATVRSFGQRVGDEVNIVATGTNTAEVTIWRTYRLVLGTIDDRISSLGGWGIDVHHFYDPATSMLYLGTGERRSAESVATTVSTFDTTPTAGDLSAIAVSSTGDVFYSRLVMPGPIQVRRRGASSTVNLGSSTYSNVTGMATGRIRVTWGTGPTETTEVLVVVDQGANTVYAVRLSDGLQQPIVGDLVAPPTPVTLAVGDVSTTPLNFLLTFPSDVAVARDGSVWISDHPSGADRLLRYRDDGYERTVQASVIFATAAEQAEHLAIGRDDILYYSTMGGTRIDAVRPDGRRRVGYPEIVVGGGAGSTDMLDGALANDCASGTCAQVGVVEDLTVDAQGHLCWIEGVHDNARARLRCIQDDQRVYTVAGTRWTDAGGTSFADAVQTFGMAFNGVPATRTLIDSPSGVAAGPDGRIYFLDGQAALDNSSPPVQTFSRVRVVSPTLDGSLLNTHLIASSDGSQLYEFTAGGRHTRTLDAVTNAVLVAFDYDTAAATLGRLRTITDFDGTTVGVSYPTSTSVRLVAPGSLQTQLNLDANNLATSIVAPLTTSSCTTAGSSGCRTWTLAYTSSMGLLTGFTDPRSGIGTHDITYDVGMTGTGRMLTDEALDDAGSSSGPTQALSLPTAVPGGWTQTTLTAAPDTLDGTFAASARERRFMTVRAGTSVMQRRVEHGPVGSLSFTESTVPADGRAVTTTTSQGDSVTVNTAPHPRWGMAAPYLGRVQRTRAYGGAVTATRTLTYNAGTNAYGSTVAVTPSPTGTGTATWTTTAAPSGGGWLVTVTPPTGALRASTYQYDARGRVTMATLPGQYPVCLTYSGLSRRPTLVRSSVLAAGTCNATAADRREFSFTYPMDGTRWTQSVAVGPSSPLTTSFTRDRRGAVGSIDLPARSVSDIATSYDEDGNLTSFRPARISLSGGTLMTHAAYGYVPTPRESMDTFTPPATTFGGTFSGTEMNADYRPDGRFRSVSLRGGQSITAVASGTGLNTGYVTQVDTVQASGTESYYVSSDVDGRPLNVTGPAGTLGLVYDSDQLREQSWSQWGTAGVSGRVTRTVSGSGYLQSEGVCFGSMTCVPTAAQTMSYGYDADGVITSAGLPSGVESIGTSVVVFGGTRPGIVRTATIGSLYHETDVPRGEMTVTMDLWNPTGETLFSETICARDNLGRVLARQEQVRGSPGAALQYRTHVYTYDTAGRVAGWGMSTSASATCANYTTTVPITHTNTYDEQGNRIASSGIPDNAANEADQPTVAGRTYDGAGRLTYSADLPGVNRTYTYDALGQLRSVHQSVLVIDYTHEYDAAGRIVAIHTTGAAAVEQRFLYRDSRNPIAWQRATTNPGGCSGGWDTWYFAYGMRAEVPDLAYVDTCTNGTIDATYRYSVDERGSVRGVIDVATGSRIQYIEYDEWGRVTAMGGTNVQPFGYAGAIALVTWPTAPYVGLWHMGARDYDPVIGRWTAHDPIRFQGGMNLYAYCDNDPVNCTDESGLIAPLIGAGIGAGFAVAFEVWAQYNAHDGNWSEVDWGAVVVAGLTGAAFGAFGAWYGALPGVAWYQVFTANLLAGFVTQVIDAIIDSAFGFDGEGGSCGGLVGGAAFRTGTFGLGSLMQGVGPQGAAWAIGVLRSL